MAKPTSPQSLSPSDPVVKPHFVYRRAVRYAAVSAVVIAAVASIVNYTENLLRWPSSQEVHQKLLNISDGQAEDFARLQAERYWRLEEAGRSGNLKTRQFFDFYNTPCLFARHELRETGSNHIATRYWGFVFLRRSAQNQVPASIVAFVSADAMGFERIDPFGLPSTDFRRDLAHGHGVTVGTKVEKMIHVAECKPSIPD